THQEPGPNDNNRTVTYPPHNQLPSSGVSNGELSRRSQHPQLASTASNAPGPSGEVGQVELQKVQEGSSVCEASPMHRSETGPYREAPEAAAAKDNRVADILRRYEKYLAEQNQQHDPGHPSVRDEGTHLLSQPNGDRDSQLPVHDDDSVSNREPTDGQPRKTLPGSKAVHGNKRGRSTAGRVGPVRKKRASARKGLEYEFLRLAEARRQGRKMQYKIIWTPTWMTLADLRGKRAIEEAEDLVVEAFGRDEWEKEAQASGIEEAAVADDEMEYVSE
ncbi:Uncharacterized protein TPAR_04523, partial [Tolypocladium paradoxum]